MNERGNGLKTRAPKVHGGFTRAAPRHASSPRGSLGCVQHRLSLVHSRGLSRAGGRVLRTLSRLRLNFSVVLDSVCCPDSPKGTFVQEVYRTLGFHFFL